MFEFTTVPSSGKPEPPGRLRSAENLPRLPPVSPVLSSVLLVSFLVNTWYFSSVVPRRSNREDWSLTGLAVTRPSWQTPGSALQSTRKQGAKDAPSSLNLKLCVNKHSQSSASLGSWLFTFKSAFSFTFSGKKWSHNSLASKADPRRKHDKRRELGTLN